MVGHGQVQWAGMIPRLRTGRSWPCKKMSHLDPFASRPQRYVARPLVGDQLVSCRRKLSYISIGLSMYRHQILTLGTGTACSRALRLLDNIQHVSERLSILGLPRHPRIGYVIPKCILRPWDIFGLF